MRAAQMAHASSVRRCWRTPAQSSSAVLTSTARSAGGIAYAAAGALGVTNVFGPRRQFIQTLASMRPESGMVCYAAGNDIQRALQDGFQALGPLRVWVRKM